MHLSVFHWNIKFTYQIYKRYSDSLLKIIQLDSIETYASPSAGGAPSAGASAGASVGGAAASSDIVYFSVKCNIVYIIVAFHHISVFCYYVTVNS